MMGHPNFEDEMLGMIGLWKTDNKVVGMAAHDMRNGEAYLICNEGYNDILKEMTIFAEKNITKDDNLFLIVNDKNNIQNDLLKSLRYEKTYRQEVILEYDFKKKNFDYSVPDGFMVTSCKEEKEVNKYVRAVWKGFENEGEPPVLDESYNKPLRQNWKEELAVFVKAPDGEYAAHCGMWYEEGEKIYQPNEK